MPVSLKTMLKHLEYDRKISRAEYEALVEKLKGHDGQIYKKAVEDFAEKLCDALSEESVETYFDGHECDMLTLDGALDAVHVAANCMVEDEKVFDVSRVKWI